MNFVFFSPYTLMWNITLVEKALKINLDSSENKIFVVNCNKDLTEHCMCFYAYGLTIHSTKEDKESICIKCVSYKNLLRAKLDKIFYDIETLLTTDDNIFIDNEIRKVNINNYENFSILNVDIGKIALHDLILIKKLSSLKKIKDNWSFYINILKTSIKCLLAFKNLVNINKIDFVISPNNLYSHHQTVAKYAKTIGIQEYSVVSNALVPHKKLQLIKLQKGIYPGFSFNALKKWQKKIFLLNKESVNFVIKYLISNFSGNHYLNFSKSKKKNTNLLKKKIGDYKVIIGIILSGAEEDLCIVKSDVDLQYSLRERIFKSQIDWLEHLTKYAEKNKEICFIVRFHPRDLKSYNRNYTENYIDLNECIKNVNLNNFIIDDPKENISIYDYLDLADVMLTYGSTTLVDFSLLGVPVIDADLSKLQYPHYFDYKDKDEYFRTINYALNGGRSLSISETYFRWFIWTNIYDSIDVSGQINKNENKNIYNIIYKTLSLILEKVGIYSIKKFELTKLENININIQKKITFFFKKKLESYIDINLESLNISSDENIIKENIKNIKGSLINFGKKYVDKESKFYTFIK
jgi:hypothetical protein